MKMRIALLTLIVLALLSTTTQADDNKNGMGNMEGMTDMKDMQNMDHSTMNAETVHHGKGVIVGIDKDNKKVVLKHEPIESMHWPSMTMGFKVKDDAMLKDLSEGKTVEFEFTNEGKDNVISTITEQ